MTFPEARPRPQSTSCSATFDGSYHFLAEKPVSSVWPSGLWSFKPTRTFDYFLKTSRSSRDRQGTVQGVLRTAGRIRKHFHTDALSPGQPRAPVSLPVPPASPPVCTVPRTTKDPTRSSRTAPHYAPYSQTFPLLLHHPDPRRTPREDRRAPPFGTHSRALGVPVRGTELCLRSRTCRIKHVPTAGTSGLDSRDSGVNETDTCSERGRGGR